MVRQNNGLLIVYGLASLLAASTLALADTQQCDRLFVDQQENSTCHTLLQLRDAPVSDEQLQEDVSQQVHGLSYSDSQAQRKEREEAVRKRREEAERDASNSQCGQLFPVRLERDVCLYFRAISGRRQSNAQLKADITEQLRLMKSDAALRETVLKGISRMTETDIGERMLAKEAEERRAREQREAQVRGEEEARAAKWRAEQMAKERDEMEARALAEAAESERKAAERERRVRQLAKARAAELDAALGAGKVGFLLRSWTLAGLGRTLVSDFLLQNNGPVPVKDFTIVCQTFGESGTRLNVTKGVVYSRLGPKERRQFKMEMGFVHPQTARATCGLTGWD